MIPVLDRRRILLACLALAFLAAAAPVLAYTYPSLVGDDEARIVLTGSMEPSIAPGDVVFLDTDVPIDEVEEGDVVTFRAHASSQTTYTHRVVDVSQNTGGTVLTTKGDANEDTDPMRTDASMLVGRVDHQVPVYGHLISTATGLPLPAVLVGLSLVTIGNEVRTLRGREDSETSFDPVGVDATGTSSPRSDRSADPHEPGRGRFDVVGLPPEGSP